MKIHTFNRLTEKSTFPFYKNIKSANFGLVHLINLMGPDVTYVETGVFKGDSLCHIVQRCPFIKTAIGIDQYKAYVDDFESKKVSGTYNQDLVDKIKQICLNNILASGFKNKIQVIEEHTRVAVDNFEDNSIDFLFLDSYCSAKDVEEELERWYNKVKINGYFAGHDWPYEGVHRSVKEFRSKYDIQSPLSVMGAEWVWLKKENI
tara:strand:+ start:1402 stop:2016 length:615 start_codon:yes stop_codon:yes gene_type:complete